MVLYFTLTAALIVAAALVLRLEIRKMAATQTDLSNAIANLGTAIKNAVERLAATPVVDTQPDVDAVNQMIDAVDHIAPVGPPA